MRNGPAIVARLRWIDDRLYWTGWFRKNVYGARFKLSANQISTDISLYNDLATAPISSSDDGRRFERPDGFVPVFNDERRLDSWLSCEEADLRPIGWDEDVAPSRWLDRDVASVLMRGSETMTPVRITYSSMTTGEVSERLICPHSLIRATGRYHVRAWDEQKFRFADFVIGRITSPALCPEETWVNSKADEAWHEHVDVHIGPHPDLDETRRDIVCAEWRMVSESAALKTRRALLSYFLDGLQLLDAVRGGHGIGPISGGICCLNARSLLAALAD